MTINAALRLMAGSVVLISLALGYNVDPTWYYLTGFVGLNMFQSGFTRWCPAVTFFKALGLKAEACSTGGMDINQGVHIIAGSLILGTVAAVIVFDLPVMVLAVTAVIGVSLIQSAFSGWCPAFTFARLAGFNEPNSTN